MARQVGVRQQLWLAEVDGVWHAYQLIPIPDSETDRVFSHLGAVDTLPTLDPAS